ncbi:hypothetical protein TA3x_002474 [Tundrisphaera sp. TA3]|uniref:hypothetical protein n=1 Tax=Tundrisphaera sp. TA3 TaxID=3435775 RepID=UPI003EB6DFA2
MRRLPSWLGLGFGLALLLFCYRPALFSGGQYGFRDAAHFYYPLYHRVQAEWDAGRWPLWDPGENAGMPLLGNPTAAVLYPGKVIYAALSYAWAARTYAVVHTAWAFLGMWMLLRPWGVRGPGATIAALGYAFGAPILFQYCNIIFLVGAAWAPWGMRAIDRWVRLRRPMALPELAVILAMIVLGGDPETAYLLGLCAGAYAFALSRGEIEPNRRDDRPARPGRIIALAAAGAVAWTAISLAGAYYLPHLRQRVNEGPVPSLPWVPWLPKISLAAWGLAGLVLLVRWRKGKPLARVLMPRLVGLAAAAALAGALSAAQLLPVLEFTRSSARATDEGPHDIYPFSLEPYRVVDLAWPGVFDRPFGEPVSWIGVIPPRGNHRVWSPSLYLGGLTLVLALGAWGFRGGAPWRAWLSGIAVASLVAGFGEFASPIFLARYIPAVAREIGAHDLPNTNTVRLDGFLRDGDGSPYSILATVLPGFHTFRYPSKLLSFTALALAALAGIGWEAAIAGRQRRMLRFSAIGAGATVAVLVAVTLARPALVKGLAGAKVATVFGPLDAAGAVSGIQAALIHGALILGAGWWLIRLAWRRPALAGTLAAALTAIDLGVANAPLVVTVDQAELEKRPEVLLRIDEAEKIDPAPGPFRIHRTPVWSPMVWTSQGSADRLTDMVRWERDTIQPKYGLLHGVDYTYTMGTAELYDYEWFFAGFPRTVEGDMMRQLGLKEPQQIVIYPRRGFDLWNTRYFVLPFVPSWNDPDRGFAALLPRTERIYPPRDAFKGPDGETKMRTWAETSDYQILRNKDAYPRAWIVHEARMKDPIVDLARNSRTRTIFEILYPADALWFDPEWVLYDPKRTAWIETDDRSQLQGFVSGGAPTASETASVVVQGPQRVELDVSLARPGLVILADIFYPGWKLTIDGQPAPILRANRIMRGAAVPSGRHRLVYTYEPGSFRVGCLISLGGLGFLVAYPIGLGWRRRWRLEHAMIRG